MGGVWSALGLWVCFGQWWISLPQRELVLAKFFFPQAMTSLVQTVLPWGLPQTAANRGQRLQRVLTHVIIRRRLDLKKEKGLCTSLCGAALPKVGNICQAQMSKFWDHLECSCIVYMPRCRMCHLHASRGSATKKRICLFSIILYNLIFKFILKSNIYYPRILWLFSNKL